MKDALECEFHVENLCFGGTERGSDEEKSR